MDIYPSASVNSRPDDVPMTGKNDPSFGRVRNSIRSIINHPEESPGLEEGNGGNSPRTTSTKKPRKKRKTFSCDTCRRVKTRCDFEPFIGKCYRCNVLQLDCSLAKDKDNEILNTLREDGLLKKINSINSNLGSLSHLSRNGSNESKSSVGKSEIDTISNHVINKRLSCLEDHIKSLHQKMDLIITSAKLINNTNVEDRTKNVQNVSANVSDTYDSPPTSSIETIKKIGEYSKENLCLNGFKLKESPLKLMHDIDESLFPSKATSKAAKLAGQQRPYAVARVNFLHFYENHQELCHKLATEFLVRSHFWIIPGGRKEIDVEYAHSHLFITSVFTIIAMSFADNDKYAAEQEVLYPLVERLLTNTLTMFEKLTAFDIEAILYCCMFHISRKAKRYRQLKFNSLVLSNFALNSLLHVIDFYQIKDRVLAKEEYSSEDLYHLRILNSLTACYLQYSIGYGEIREQDVMLKEFNELVAKFPQANFGDDIKISEINLGDIVNGIFMNFKNYFMQCSSEFNDNRDSNNQSNFVIIFPELNYWLKNWEELLTKDGAGVLLFTFDFYHIMICRTFITEFSCTLRNDQKFLKSILNTMKEHSFSLLNGFLRLPPTLIRGAPIFTCHQLVYACLTLCDYLYWFASSERQHVLSLCTKVYWHLSTIGEKMNEATDNVGKIIKSIIDTSKTRINIDNSPLENGENDTILTTANKHREPTIPNLRKTTNSPKSNDMHETLSNNHFMIPDVDQFNSFEDFFQDFFDSLKPTSQKMFTNDDKTEQAT
ncbi:YDR520C [Saccharomyces arboricola H-6]|uniref:Transcriptional activator of proteases prtT n=1 Tax=Saccharomyces arboricola (strain H-6 / AS 2.3317 / CBS 10644) TaxID=1160507 RepID=J8Q3H4_SACAR|nr:YDR520C [Saccharomyces arboricola H-6]